MNIKLIIFITLFMGELKPVQLNGTSGKYNTQAPTYIHNLTVDPQSGVLNNGANRDRLQRPRQPSVTNSQSSGKNSVDKSSLYKNQKGISMDDKRPQRRQSSDQKILRGKSKSNFKSRGNSYGKGVSHGRGVSHDEGIRQFNLALEYLLKTMQNQSTFSHVEESDILKNFQKLLKYMKRFYESSKKPEEFVHYFQNVLKKYHNMIKTAKILKNDDPLAPQMILRSQKLYRYSMVNLKAFDQSISDLLHFMSRQHNYDENVNRVNKYSIILLKQLLKAMKNNKSSYGVEVTNQQLQDGNENNRSNKTIPKILIKNKTPYFKQHKLTDKELEEIVRIETTNMNFTNDLPDSPSAQQFKQIIGEFEKNRTNPYLGACVMPFYKLYDTIGSMYISGQEYTHQFYDKEAVNSRPIHGYIYKTTFYKPANKEIRRVRECLSNINQRLFKDIKVLKNRFDYFQSLFQLIFALGSQDKNVEIGYSKGQIPFDQVKKMDQRNDEFVRQNMNKKDYDEYTIKYQTMSERHAQLGETLNISDAQIKPEIITEESPKVARQQPIRLIKKQTTKPKNDLQHQYDSEYLNFKFDNEKFELSTIYLTLKNIEKFTNRKFKINKYTKLFMYSQKFERAMNTIFQHGEQKEVIEEDSKFLVYKYKKNLIHLAMFWLDELSAQIQEDQILPLKEQLQLLKKTVFQFKHAHDYSYEKIFLSYQKNSPQQTKFPDRKPQINTGPIKIFKNKPLIPLVKDDNDDIKDHIKGLDKLKEKIQHYDLNDYGYDTPENVDESQQDNKLDTITDEISEMEESIQNKEMQKKQDNLQSEEGKDLSEENEESEKEDEEEYVYDVEHKPRNVLKNNLDDQKDRALKFDEEKKKNEDKNVSLVGHQEKDQNETKSLYLPIQKMPFSSLKLPLEKLERYSIQNPLPKKYADEIQQSYYAFYANFKGDMDFDQKVLIYKVINHLMFDLGIKLRALSYRSIDVKLKSLIDDVASFHNFYNEGDFKVEKISFKQVFLKPGFKNKNMEFKEPHKENEKLNDKEAELTKTSNSSSIKNKNEETDLGAEKSDPEISDVKKLDYTKLYKRSPKNDEQRKHNYFLRQRKPLQDTKPKVEPYLFDFDDLKIKREKQQPTKVFEKEQNFKINYEKLPMSHFKKGLIEIERILQSQFETIKDQKIIFKSVKTLVNIINQIISQTQVLEYHEWYVLLKFGKNQIEELVYHLNEMKYLIPYTKFHEVQLHMAVKLANFLTNIMHSESINKFDITFFNPDKSLLSPETNVHKVPKDVVLLRYERKYERDLKLKKDTLKNLLEFWKDPILEQGPLQLEHIPRSVLYKDLMRLQKALYNGSVNVTQEPFFRYNILFLFKSFNKMIVNFKKDGIQEQNRTEYKYILKFFNLFHEHLILLNNQQTAQEENQLIHELINRMQRNIQEFETASIFKIEHLQSEVKFQDISFGKMKDDSLSDLNGSHSKKVILGTKQNDTYKPEDDHDISEEEKKDRSKVDSHRNSLEDEVDSLEKEMNTKHTFEKEISSGSEIEEEKYSENIKDKKVTLSDEEDTKSINYKREDSKAETSRLKDGDFSYDVSINQINPLTSRSNVQEEKPLDFSKKISQKFTPKKKTYISNEDVFQKILVQSSSEDGEKSNDEYSKQSDEEDALKNSILKNVSNNQDDSIISGDEPSDHSSFQKNLKFEIDNNDESVQEDSSQEDDKNKEYAKTFFQKQNSDDLSHSKIIHTSVLDAQISGHSSDENFKEILNTPQWGNNPLNKQHIKNSSSVDEKTSSEISEKDNEKFETRKSIDLNDDVQSKDNIEKNDGSQKSRKSLNENSLTFENVSDHSFDELEDIEDEKRANVDHITISGESSNRQRGSSVDKYSTTKKSRNNSNYEVVNISDDSEVNNDHDTIIVSDDIDKKVSNNDPSIEVDSLSAPLKDNKSYHSSLNSEMDDNSSEQGSSKNDQTKNNILFQENKSEVQDKEDSLSDKDLGKQKISYRSRGSQPQSDNKSESKENEEKDNYSKEDEELNELMIEDEPYGQLNQVDNVVMIVEYVDCIDCLQDDYVYLVERSSTFKPTN